MSSSAVSWRTESESAGADGGGGGGAALLPGGGGGMAGGLPGGGGGGEGGLDPGGGGGGAAAFFSLKCSKAAKARPMAPIPKTAPVPVPNPGRIILRTMRGLLRRILRLIIPPNSRSASNMEHSLVQKPLSGKCSPKRQSLPCQG